MNKYVKIAALGFVVVALAACGGKKNRRAGKGGGSDYDSGSSSSPYTGPSTSGRTGSVVGSPTGAGGTAAGGGVAPTGRVVYFEFDSSELNAEGQALVDAWGAWLAAHPAAKVRLEGHADERGTREYNVGLGERRANTVQQALTARGVAERQLSVSSFGEERPVNLGHDEAAWSQNRRVELVQ